MYKKYLLNLLYYCLGFILLGVIYEVIVLAKDNSYFTPGFNEIFSFLGEALTKSKTWISILKTLLDVFLSILISFILAIIVSILSYRFRILHKIIHPMMVILRFIPIIILINVIWFIFAMTNKPYVLYLSVFSMLFPMMYEAIYQSLITLDKKYIDAYKIYSNISPLIVFRVYIPLVLSSIKSSIINGIGIGIKVALSCEFILGMRQTLGYLIQGEIQNGISYSGVYAYIIILIVISIILELIPLVLMFIYGKIRDVRLKKRFIDYERRED